MKETQTVNLLEQLEIACIRPGKYIKLIKLSKIRKGFFFFFLILFLVLIEAGIPFVAWNYHVGGFRNFFTQEIPQFKITKEGFETAEKVDFDLHGAVKIVMDSGKKEFTAKDLSEEYPAQILIAKENVLIKSLDIENLRFAFLEDAVIDNDTLVALIPWIKVFIVLFFIVLFFSKAMEYIFYSLAYTLFTGRMVRTKDGKTLKFSEAFTISLYAKTLFAIVESISICLGGMIDFTILSVIRIFFTIGWIRRGQISVLGEEMKSMQ